MRPDQQVALAASVKRLAEDLQRAIASAASKPYQAHFKTLKMACSPLGLDPLSLTEQDLGYVSLFFVLSRSVNSLDGFWSAIKSVYTLHGRQFPAGPSFKPFRKLLRKVFQAADTVSRAWALPPEVFKALISSLDMSRREHVVLGIWFFSLYIFVLRPEDIHHGHLRHRDVKLLADGGVDFSVYPGKGAEHHGIATFSAAPHPAPHLCLSRWFAALRSLTPSDLVAPDLPVLVHSAGQYRGQPISTRWFVKRLRSLYFSVYKSEIPEAFSAYSLRRGGATAYYDAGLKEIHLQHTLRHKSLESTQVYINSSDNQAARRAITSHLLTDAK